MNQEAPLKVCHFTSVHPAHDTRILLKECQSAAAAGFQTVLVATDCQEGTKAGVLIRNVPRSEGRLKRMFATAWRVYRRAKAEEADIYHFHDPELLPYGVLLRMQGKRVIYDAHEDVPEDIMTKEWIHPVVRRCVSLCFRLFEDWACRKMSQVIAATPAIRERFRRAGCVALDINNYPIVGELRDSGLPYRPDKSVCFVGVISDIRGAVEMVTAIGKTECTLDLAGEFSPPELRDQVRGLTGWDRVVEHGQVSRDAVARILSESMAGLVLYHPGPNHTDAQPNKMFEYMSAGIPVIASDFPLWREIVEGNNCGLCVNPLDVAAIAEAINWLSANSQEIRKMGDNGVRAVNERYNWQQESTKLIDLYRSLVHP